MSIPAIGAVGFTPMVAPTMPASATSAASALDAAGSTGAASATSGTDFAKLLSNGLENLQGLHTQTDQLAVKAATGDLNAIHDYTITATEASVATQLTTAVRNKALEAFQEIMRMSV
jgi:flagellar hook-basal body complex protein FliE